ncbi:nucleolar transcription factor 1-like isoform X2 [Varroa destructor]|uniref:HMG box domain-containing protein n=1 Tax=Varroa destructor TaxID=109461 RepID=A0A7M7JA16_VARDE|nr:nucleolar transcription factor 1-like isoform X2 [Varroa destructor]
MSLWNRLSMCMTQIVVGSKKSHVLCASYRFCRSYAEIDLSKQPKRPRYPFLRFMLGLRQAELRNHPASKLSKIASVKWQQMSEDEKAPYIEEFKKENAEHRKQMERFKETLGLGESEYQQALKWYRANSKIKSKRQFRKIIEELNGPKLTVGSPFGLFFHEASRKSSEHVTHERTQWQQQSSSAGKELTETEKFVFPKQNSGINQTPQSRKRTNKGIVMAKNRMQFYSDKWRALSKQEKELYRVEYNDRINEYNRRVITWWTELSSEQRDKVVNAYERYVIWFKNRGRPLRPPPSELVDVFGEQQANSLYHRVLKQHRKCKYSNGLPFPCVQNSSTIRNGDDENSGEGETPARIRQRWSRNKKELGFSIKILERNPR